MLTDLTATDLVINSSIVCFKFSATVLLLSASVANENMIPPKKNVLQYSSTFVRYSTHLHSFSINEKNKVTLLFRENMFPVYMYLIMVL